MSLFDVIDDGKYYVNRYLWPVLFIVAGAFLLNMALNPSELELSDPNKPPAEIWQGKPFMYAAALFLFAGVVWLLFLFGLVKSFVSYIVLAVLLVLSVGVLYYTEQSIMNDVTYNNNFAKIESEIKTRMLDIKTAQQAFKEANDCYTDNFDSLAYFVQNGKKMVIQKVGSVPDRTITPEERDLIYGDNRPIDKLMTEEEAYWIVKKSAAVPQDLQNFKRDTTYVPVMEAIFTDERYLDKRSKQGGLIGFHPDSLQFVPYCDLLTKMDTSSIPKGDFRVPTLEFTMVHPMNSTKVYTMGSLTDNHLRENWDD